MFNKQLKKDLKFYKIHSEYWERLYKEEEARSYEHLNILHDLRDENKKLKEKINELDPFT